MSMSKMSSMADLKVGQGPEWVSCCRLEAGEKMVEQCIPRETTNILVPLSSSCTCCWQQDCRCPMFICKKGSQNHNAGYALY